MTHRGIPWEALAASYESGTPIARLAAIYGLSYTVVRENLLRRGVTFRRRGRPRKPA